MKETSNEALDVGQRNKKRPEDLRLGHGHRQIRRGDFPKRDDAVSRQPLLPRARDHPGHPVRLRHRRVVNRLHPVRDVHGQDSICRRQQ